MKTSILNRNYDKQLINKDEFRKLKNISDYHDFWDDKGENIHIYFEIYEELIDIRIGKSSNEGFRMKINAVKLGKTQFQLDYFFNIALNLIQWRGYVSKHCYPCKSDCPVYNGFKKCWVCEDCRQPTQDRIETFSKGLIFHFDEKCIENHIILLFINWGNENLIKMIVEHE